MNVIEMLLASECPENCRRNCFEQRAPYDLLKTVLRVIKHMRMGSVEPSEHGRHESYTQNSSQET